MATSPQWDYIAKLVCIGDSGCGKSSLTIRLCEGRFVSHHDVTIGVEFGSRIVPVGPPAQKDPLSLSSTKPQSSTASTDPADPVTASISLPPPPIKPKNKSSAAASEPAPQKHMKLSLWDTAGQETYKSVTRSYFRGASGALLVFDLSRRSTFVHATDWLADLRQIAEPDIVVVLVGNKADLVSAAPGRRKGEDQDGGDGDPEDRREVTRAEAEAWAKRNGVLEYVETSAKSGEGVENAFMHVAERIYDNIQAGKYDLNDRRSGVKGANAAGPGGARPVRLNGGAPKGAAAGCC